MWSKEAKGVPDLESQKRYIASFLTVSSTKAGNVARSAGEPIGWKASARARMSCIRRIATEHANTRSKLGATQGDHVFAVNH